MLNEFRRFAIVNRGEAAMRFIHAAREFRHEYDVPLRTIALFTEPERQAMFVREADESICLGTAQFIDPLTHRPKNSYLDYDRLAKALVSSSADAVWVGWGFVAEQACDLGRAKRVERYSIRELSAEEQERFAEAWKVCQARFVDQPGEAVSEAHRLVNEVMRRRGYPVSEEFERNAGDISVDHPRVVEHYRVAYELASRQSRGRLVAAGRIAQRSCSLRL